MLHVSLLQGSAGKIFIESLSPKFLILSLPLVLYYLLVINTTVLFDFSHPEQFSMAAMTVGFITSYSIFAVNGKNGHYHTFWFKSAGQLLNTLKVLSIFSLLTILFSLPFGIFAYLYQEEVNYFLSHAVSIFDQYSMKEKMLGTCGLIFTGVGLSFALTAMAVVAANCQRYYDLLTPSFWANTIYKRLGDIMLINALIVSQIFFTTFIYILPIITCLYFVDKLITLSSAHMIFALITPSLLSSICLGKLSGAFGYDNESLSAGNNYQQSYRPLRNRKKQNLPISHTQEQPEHTTITASYEQGIESDDKMQVKTPSELEQVLEAHSRSPEDIDTLCKLITIYQREGNSDEMLAHANNAIALGVRQGKLEQAAKIYSSCGKNKAKIRLEADEFQELAIFFEKQKHYLDAWRCYSRLFDSDGTEENVIQHKLLGLAKEASTHHAISESAKLYHFFIKKYPHSELRSYAENALELLKIA